MKIRSTLCTTFVWYKWSKKKNENNNYKNNFLKRLLYFTSYDVSRKKKKRENTKQHKSSCVESENKIILWPTPAGARQRAAPWPVYLVSRLAFRRNTYYMGGGQDTQHTTTTRDTQHARTSTRTHTPTTTRTTANYQTEKQRYAPTYPLEVDAEMLQHRQLCSTDRSHDSFTLAGHNSPTLSTNSTTTTK